MKRLIAVALLAGVAGLAEGCGRNDPAAATTDTPTPATSAPVAPAPTPPTPVAAMEPAVAAAAGAPAFAVLYPGGEVEAPAIIASGPDGPGGLVTFLTDAEPDAVIAFYRSRAEAEGLSSVMAMNQGEARAYGAARPEAGANLQVVASPTEEGATSVQLSWSTGR